MTKSVFCYQSSTISDQRMKQKKIYQCQSVQICGQHVSAVRSDPGFPVPPVVTSTPYRHVLTLGLSDPSER